MKNEVLHLNNMPRHINLEENTPLYLHIVKNVRPGIPLIKSSDATNRLPLKARWIPPPGKTTSRTKRYNKQIVQIINSRAQTADIRDLMMFVGDKVDQLESLTSALQEIVSRNNRTVSGEKTSDVFKKLTEQSEKSFLKLYQEQQHLIGKCLEVIDSSKRTIQQSKAKCFSSVRDAGVQTRSRTVTEEPDKKEITDKEKIAADKRKELKMCFEVEQLKKSLSRSKDEIENYKKQFVQFEFELKEKVELLQRLAVERDSWKIQLTLLTNEKLEMETQVTCMKSQVLNLQKEVSIIAQKTADTRLTEEENERLRTAKTILENQVLDARNEVGRLQNQIEMMRQELQMNVSKPVASHTGLSVPVVVKDASNQTTFPNVHLHTGGDHRSSSSPSYNEKIKTTLADVERLKSELSEKKVVVESLNAKLKKKELQVNLLNDKLDATRKDAQNEQSKWSNNFSSLEVALWNKKSEISELKREKNQVEENYLSKLNEVEKKLESAVTTNRSLQNYIALLRNSYASVFSDPALSTLPQSSTFLPF